MIVSFALTGCASFNAPVVPPTALIYTDYKVPLMTKFSGTEIGPKIGMAKTHYLYIYLNFAWGDASIEEAAKKGNITKVNAADYEFMNVLGIYNELTVWVYGE